MGYASGFQAGSAVAQRALDAYEQGRQRQLKERIGQEAARYDVTEGAYGQGLGENIQQVQDLQRQAGQYAAAQGGSEEDIARAEQQYAPSIQELTRRQGLTAPDYSVGSRETNFGTRQEARQAASPMRTEGLSNVYRQAGEIEKADELEARAFEQQRGLAQETRAQAQFKTQQEAAGLQLDKARREAEAAARMDLFDAWTAENPGADLAAMKDAASKFKLSQDQVLGVTARMAGLQENELKLWKGEVQNTIKGKTDAELVDIFNKDDRFDPTTNMERKVGKDGSITLTLKRQDGTVVSTYKAPDAATATAYLRKQALEPETLADWLLDRKKTEAAIATSAAQAAAAGRSNRGEKSLAQKVADAEAALGRKLTNDEKSILVGLANRPGADSGKAVPVKEEGEKVMVNGRLMITDGMGGYLDPKAVLPSQRAQVLKAAEIPDNMVDQVQWNKSGTAVGFGGKMYDPKDPKDMRELKEDYVRLGANTIAVQEAQLNTPGRPTTGMGPRLTYLPSENSPSIYATPEQRAAFARQRQEELLRQQRNEELAARMRGLYLQQQGQ
jgi:hypothetical protein